MLDFALQQEIVFLKLIQIAVLGLSAFPGLPALSALSMGAFASFVVFEFLVDMFLVVFVGSHLVSEVHKLLFESMYFIIDLFFDKIEEGR